MFAKPRSQGFSLEGGRGGKKSAGQSSRNLTAIKYFWETPFGTRYFG